MLTRYSIFFYGTIHRVARLKRSNDTKYILLMATKMTEPIQYTMLIPKLIKMLGETILIVPTTKIYCKITSENKIINSK